MSDLGDAIRKKLMYADLAIIAVNNDQAFQAVTVIERMLKVVESALLHTNHRSCDCYFDCTEDCLWKRLADLRAAVLPENKNKGEK